MRRLALACALMGTGLAGAAGEGVITFAAEQGEKRISSGTVLLAGERVAAIAVVGADPARARAESGEELDLVEFDPVTRLAILSRPKELAGEPASGQGSSLDLRQGDAVYLGADRKEASRVVKWESTFRGKVLPVALIRIHHPSKERPVPGTALTNEKGEVVAICHQAAPKFGNGTFALPIEVVQRMEKDIKSRGRVAACWIGVTVNASNPVLAVEMVRPESPGAKAGVVKGDILLAVGPREVSSYADARNAFYYLVAGEATSLRILRGTRRLDLEVIPEVHPVFPASSQE